MRCRSRTGGSITRSAFRQSPALLSPVIIEGAVSAIRSVGVLRTDALRDGRRDVRGAGQSTGVALR